MLRLVGVNIPDDVDVFSGLRMIKGLDTKHSRTRIERILTQARLFSYKEDESGKKVKVYPKVGDLSWTEKKRLINLVDVPRAVVRNVRMSPTKVRLVADAIRGKHVDEALAILQFTPKAAAPVLHKLLKSAIANAGNNHELKASNLFVAKIMVDGGTTMRRFMARARGRACRIRKRTCSAVIVLREKFVMPKAAPAKAAGTDAKQAAPKAAKPAKSTASKGTATKARQKNTVEGGK